MSIQHEIWSIIVGAAIGFAFSIGATVVVERMKARGKVKLYAKIAYSKSGDHKTWGFQKNRYSK